jgi:hypothetical protein
VSVPANADAVITLFSREKLTHPAVKGWAGRMSAGRPKLVTSGYDPPAAVKATASALAAELSVAIERGEDVPAGLRSLLRRRLDEADVKDVFDRLTA